MPYFLGNFNCIVCTLLVFHLSTLVNQLLRSSQIGATTAFAVLVADNARLKALRRHNADTRGGGEIDQSKQTTGQDEQVR